MAPSLVQQMQGGGRTAKEFKNSCKPYEQTKLQSYKTATPFQFFTLHRLQVLVFTRLNMTSGRANGVMPWLLMVTGTR